jgi:hypothetical protein
MDDLPTAWEFMDHMAVIENELMIETQVKQDLQGRLVSLQTTTASLIDGLGTCGIHRGSLNSTKVWLFRSLVVTVTGRIRLGNRWGDSHALTIQWVHVGDPLHVHTHY